MTRLLGSLAWCVLSLLRQRRLESGFESRKIVVVGVCIFVLLSRFEKDRL